MKLRKAHSILPFSPESRRTVRPIPGQAPPMPMEYTLWEYGWWDGGGSVGGAM